MGFSAFFSNQARRPSGWFGRVVMSKIFDIGNARLNRFVREALAPQPGDRILDVGCGTGGLVDRIARQTRSCVVEGLDFSETMVALARRKNRKHISTHKVANHEGDLQSMPFAPGSFTKACSVNTIYFWDDLHASARAILELLKPEGRLVLGFEDQAQLKQRQLDWSVFRTYSTAEVEAVLRRTGLTQDVVTRSGTVGPSTFHCVVATRPSKSRSIRG